MSLKDDAIALAVLDAAFLERFWSSVDRSGSCWLWTAGLHNGYGVTRVGRYGCVRVHRISWTIAHGRIQDSFDVLHDCPGGDNRACLNPAHLWLGTDLENNRDAIAKGKKCQFVGVENGQAVMTNASVAELRAMCASGSTIRSAARHFGIDDSTAGLIVRRRTWKHVQ